MGVSVNVKGTVFFYKHTAAQMIKQGHGGRMGQHIHILPRFVGDS